MLSPSQRILLLRTFLVKNRIWYKSQYTQYIGNIILGTRTDFFKVSKLEGNTLEENADF